MCATDERAVPGAVQGSSFFLGGLVLVIWGWAVVGMLVEAYGFWLLFAGFFPTVLSFLRRIPVLGRALDLPMLKSVRSGLGVGPNAKPHNIHARPVLDVHFLGRALALPMLKALRANPAYVPRSVRAGSPLCLSPVLACTLLSLACCMPVDSRARYLPGAGIRWQGAYTWLFQCYHATDSPYQMSCAVCMCYKDDVPCASSIDIKLTIVCLKVA